jgi:signal transduction histidine kinase
VELTHNAVAEFQSGARRIELTTNGVKPQSTTIRANPEAFSRAIRNLLENAIKYSPESSEVQVDLSRQGDRLAIRVHDGGFGIPVEEQKRIFDKFVRGAAAKALNVPGTGIGLAMTHHIVHAHGGEIQLESEPGRGTTFTILLPVSNL